MQEGHYLPKGLRLFPSELFRNEQGKFLAIAVQRRAGCSLAARTTARTNELAFARAASELAPSGLKHASAFPLATPRSFELGRNAPLREHPRQTKERLSRSRLVA